MKKFKVWYIPQVPMKAWEVEVQSLDTARLVLECVVQFSNFEFENKVKPDYSDVGGICEWVDGEWEDVDEMEGNSG